jgi:ent-kaurene synthase
MASTIFPPELYHASIAWIQNSILTTIVDDFFDGGGSTQELENLVAVIEKYSNTDLNTIASVALEN